MSKSVEPDFISLVNNYQLLSKGQQAEIRRATEPEELLLIPSFYYLIRKTELKADRQGCRVIWFLPLVQHQEKAESLGRTMANKDLNERRLLLIVRSEYPNDLLHLRRVLQQIKPSLNWKEFGDLIYFWGKGRKQTIMKDYYLQWETKDQKGDSNE